MLIHGVDPGLLWVPLVCGIFVFPEGFLLPQYRTHMDCQVGLEAKREVVSLLHWHPRKAGRLAMWKIWEASLFSRFPKGGTAKIRGKYYLRTQTQCLHLASRCHCPAPNNHQKAPQRLCSFTSQFSELNFAWSFRVRTLGHRVPTSLTFSAVKSQNWQCLHEAVMAFSLNAGKSVDP